MMVDAALFVALAGAGIKLFLVLLAGVGAALFLGRFFNE